MARMPHGKEHFDVKKRGQVDCYTLFPKSVCIIIITFTATENKALKSVHISIK